MPRSLPSRAPRVIGGILAMVAAVIVVFGISVVVHTVAEVDAGIGSGVRVQPANPDGSTFVISCDGAAVIQPPGFVLTCADAGAHLTDLVWEEWGPDAASGEGVLHVRRCDPTCAADGGETDSYPVQVIADQPVHRGAVSAYDRLRLTFPGVAPWWAEDSGMAEFDLRTISGFVEES
ncbi:hypothetical protein [Cellulomonas sp. NPDC089187]|uniref:hypothetical protein n=1 Tax=Cellulomonas sp. NPDC089187 TaxID=3154970 RepID=UPI00343E877C